MVVDRPPLEASLAHQHVSFEEWFRMLLHLLSFLACVLLRYCQDSLLSGMFGLTELAKKLVSNKSERLD